MPPLGLSKREMLGRTMLMVLACIRCCIPTEVLGSSWPLPTSSPVLVWLGAMQALGKQVHFCAWSPAGSGYQQQLPSAFGRQPIFPTGCDRFWSCSSAQTSYTQHKDGIPFTHVGATALLMQPCHQHVPEPPQDLEIAITRPFFPSSCTGAP